MRRVPWATSRNGSYWPYGSYSYNGLMKLTSLVQIPGVSLPLMRAGTHACAYLPDRIASDLFVLSGSVDAEMYQALMDHGFRRAGPLYYRPDCPNCRACE